MPFVIHYPKEQKYMKLKKDVISWDEDVLQAHRFETEKNAQNFIRNQLKSINICASDVEAVNFGSQILKGSAKLTADEATEYVERIPKIVAEFYDVGRIVRSLLNYYSEMVRETDMETNDLLHKIEFSNLSAVDGYRMYKQLHDVRIRRRTAKDNLDMLELFVKSGFTTSLVNLQTRSSELQASLESRTYQPRILHALFEKVP